MTKLPQPGDQVSWQTSQGKTAGTVEKIVTRPTRIKGYTAKASADNPEVLVKSAKTGQLAVHQPGTLKRG